MCDADEVEPWVLSKRAAVTGGTVAWDRFGDGAPVVLVHGTPSWSFLWRNVVPPLAERFTVYVLDLLGYGDSERRDGQDTSIAAQRRALAELLAQWGLEEPALIGHDIGGATVLRAHLVEGRPVDRIGLVDAAALNPWITAATHRISRRIEPLVRRSAAPEAAPRCERGVDLARPCRRPRTPDARSDRAISACIRSRRRSCSSR